MVVAGTFNVLRYRFEPAIPHFSTFNVFRDIKIILKWKFAIKELKIS